MASGIAGNSVGEENHTRTFYEYYTGLKEDVKRRYVEELNSITNEMDDPYTFSANMIPPDSFLDLQHL